MQKIWHYLENQFLTKTKKNYKKSVKLSNYHDSVLNLMRVTEPLLEPIYTRYHILHTALTGSYSVWQSFYDLQQSKTAILEDLLATTYRQLDVWDTAIRVALVFESADYNFVFTDGRKPFTRGTIQQQVMAYHKLGLNLASYPTLAAVKAEVDAAYLALDAARDEQEGAKAVVKTNSGLVEAARKAAMTMQWRNLGFAIDTFPTNINFIESLFDVVTLRESPQTVFVGTIAASGTKEVFTRKFLATDSLKVENTGTAEIWFYYSNIKKGTNSTPVAVAPNSVRTFLVSAFAVPDYNTYRFLTAVNQSSEDTAHYIVTIL